MQINPNRSERLYTFLERALEHKTSEALKQLENIYTVAPSDLTYEHLFLFKQITIKDQPPEIQSVLKAIDTAAQSSLGFHPILKKLWENVPSDSVMNEWLVAMDEVLPPKAATFIQCLGGDWIGLGKMLDGSMMVQDGGLSIFEYLPTLLRSLSSHSSYFKKVLPFIENYSKLALLLNSGDLSHSIQEIEKACIETVKNTSFSTKSYIPLGYVNPPNCERVEESTEWLVMELYHYMHSHFRVRLLNGKQNPLHVFDPATMHFHPVIEWEDVPLEKLLNPDIYRCLFGESFLSIFTENSNQRATYFGFLSHVLQLCRFFQRNIHSSAFPELQKVVEKYTYSPDTLKSFLEEVRNTIRYNKSTLEGKSVIAKNIPLSKQIVNAAPTEMPNIKSKRFGAASFYAMNLIAFAQFGKENNHDYKIFKVQERLALLIHLYWTLQREKCFAWQISTLIETALKGEKRLLNSLEKILSFPLTDQQQKVILQIAATYKDWKARFEHYRKEVCFPFHKQYPDLEKQLLHTPHTITGPVGLHTLHRPAANDNYISMAMEGIVHTPFPQLEKIALRDFNTYLTDLLNDALKQKNYLRPTELSAWLHNRFFSELPIPKGKNDVYARYAAEPKEAIVQWMVELHKLSLFYFAEARKHNILLPWHVVDLMKVYRIQCHFLEIVIPKTKALSFSWEIITRATSHRGLDLIDRTVNEQLKDIIASFKERSPEGGKTGPVGPHNIFPLFDTSWNELPLHEYGDHQIHEYVLQMSVFKQPYDLLYSATSQKGYLEFLKAANKTPDEIAYSNHYPHERKSENYAYLTAQQAHGLLIEAIYADTCSKKEKNEWDFLKEGPYDFCDGKGWYITKENFFKSCFKNSFVLPDSPLLSAHKMHRARPGSPYDKALKSLCSRNLNEFRRQADIIREAQKENLDQAAMELLLIAEGPIENSIPLLLAFFEVRSHLLKQEEAGQFFLSVISTGTLLTDLFRREPQMLNRFTSLLEKIHIEDCSDRDSEGSIQRLLWTAEVYEKICQASQTTTAARLQESIEENLFELLSNGPENTKGIAAAHFLNLFHDTSHKRRLAKALFTFGTCQSLRNEDAHIIFQASRNAKVIGQTLFECCSMEELNAIINDCFPGENISIEKLSNKTFTDLKELQEIERAITEHKHWIEWIAAFLPRLSAWSPNGWQTIGAKNLALDLKQKLEEANVRKLQIRRKFLSQNSEYIMHQSATTYIKWQEKTFEIDWHKGILFKGGQQKIYGALLPKMQNDPSLSFLGKMLQVPVAFTPITHTYVPTDTSISLSFSLNPQSVYYTFEQHRYKLIPEPQTVCHLPQALDQTTLWVQEEDSPTGLLSLHASDGKPVPFLRIDHRGTIKKLDNPSLSLCKRTSTDHFQFFTQLGCAMEDLLLWMDPQGKVMEVNLPFQFEQQPWTTFEWKEHKWYLKGTQLYVKDITCDDTLPDLLTTPYLLLSDSGSNGFILIGEASFRTIQKRIYFKQILNKWGEVFKGTFENCLLLPLNSRKQLDPKSTRDALIVGQLYLASGEYQLAKKYFLYGLNPLGRSYSKQEFSVIADILNFPSENNFNRTVLVDYDDRSTDVAALRLFCFLHAHRHLKKYPLQCDLDTQLQYAYEVLTLAQFEEKKRVHGFNRAVWFREQYESMRTGSASLSENKLEELFTTYDEELFLRMGFTTGLGYEEKFVGFIDRLKRVPLSKTQTTSHWARVKSSPGSQYEYDYLNDRSVNDELIFRKIFSAQRDICLHATLFDLKTSSFSSFSLFQKAYRLLTIPFETLANSEKEEHKLLKDYLQRYVAERVHLHPDFTKHLGMNVLVLYAYIERNVLLEALLIILQNPSRPWPLLPEIKSIGKGSENFSPQDKERGMQFLKDLQHTLGSSFQELIIKRHIQIMETRGRILVYNLLNNPAVNDDLTRNLSAPVPYYLKQVKEKWSLLSKPEETQFTRVNFPYHLMEQALSPFILPSLAPSFESLEKIQVQLKELEGVLIKQRDIVLTEANRLPKNKLKEQLKEIIVQSRRRPTRSIDQCIGLALQESESQWKKNCPFSDPAVLQKETCLYIALATEEAYLQRLEAKLRKCLDGTASQKESKELVNDLKTKRNYPFTAENNLPMIAEYYLNIRLTDEQTLNLNTLRHKPLDSSLKGIITKLGMGKGKSKVLAPMLLIDQLKSNGISFYVVPNALFGTAKDDIQHTLWTKFQKRAELFTFVRDQVNEEYLQCTLDQLFRAQQEGTILITRSNDLQALGLMLTERHEILRMMEATFLGRLDKLREEGDHKRYFQALSKFEEELSIYRNEIEWIQPIQNGLHHYGKFLFDEVAHTFERNQLCFPIGTEQPANPLAATVALDLYFDDLPDFEESVRIETNNQIYCKGETLNRVLASLADRQWNHYHNELKECVTKETFVNYILGRVDLTPDQETALDQFVTVINTWDKSPNLIQHQLAQKIAFLKYCLSEGLAGAMDAPADERYGHSKVEHDLSLVIFFECNDTPKEGTRFKHFWETLLKTCQYYRQKWHRTSETKKVLRLIAHKLLEKPNHFVGIAAERLFGKGWQTLNHNDPKLLEDFTHRIDQSLKSGNFKREARAIVKLFLSEEVFPRQLKVDPVQLTSTAHELTRLPNQANGFGGTITYNAVWPSNVERFFQEKIEEELVAIYKNGSHTCHTITGTQPILILDQVKAFADHKMCALIDAGALVKGVPSEKIASLILNTWPDRKGVLFYHIFESGISELALLTEKGLFRIGGSDHALIKAALKKHTIENPITFYDQSHCIGCDIPQPEGSYGVVFLSGQVITDDLHQATMRLRGLIHHLQTLKFAIPTLMGDKKWDVAAVLEATDGQQKKKEGLVHYHGILAQLRAILIAHYYEAMKTEPRIDFRAKIHARSASFVLEHNQNNLVANFAAKRTRIPAKDGIHRCLKKLPVDQIATDPAAKDQIHKSLKRILAGHEGTYLPEAVTGEQQLCETQEKERSGSKQKQMEEEFEKMLPSKLPLNEHPWKKYRKDLITPSPLKTPGNEIPAFYSMNDVLSEMKLPALFDKNLYISENLLRTFRGQGQTFLTHDHKACHRLLVILHQNNYSVSMISEQDSMYLQQCPEPRNEEGFWIVESNGKVTFSGKTPWMNPFTHEIPALSLLLLQTMIVRGDALHLLHLIDAVKKPLARWTGGDKFKKKMIAELFEHAISHRTDDFKAYQQFPELKRLFHE